MAKTYRNLYSDIHTWNNLYEAWRKARKGKRGRIPAAAFEFNLEANLVDLQDKLAAKRYQPGAYHSFYIHEPKRRLISAAPFRDRVVHHALCNIIEPIFERGFIYDSYANRVGKGTHRALDRAQQYARRFPYVLQMDVRQFFPSIDHAILRQILARKLADPAIFWLIDRILESGRHLTKDLTGLQNLSDITNYKMDWFPNDDLFAATRPRGLPIGNLTSQFWGNCYLNPLDHFIKRELKCKGYIRYVDDLLLFGDDKLTLHSWRQAVTDKMAELRLTIHPGAHPRPVTEGIPFLGFVIYPQYRRLKRRKAVYARRRLQAQRQAYLNGDIPLENLSASVQGWVNHARYGDTWGLRCTVLRDVVV